MAAIAALFQRTFRASDGPVPASLEAYLVAAYLEHPAYDPEVASRVHVDDSGRVTGFVGVFPSRFSFLGRDIRAAVAGTLMVEDPEREPLAGAKLLRSVTKGPQDITISETTNLISQRLWTPIGGRTVAAMSLDWLRPLRPFAALQSMAAEKQPSLALLAPLATVADWLGRAAARRVLATPPRDPRLVVDAGCTPAAFADAALQLSAPIALRPAWTRSDLEWLLAHAEHKARYGPLRCALVLRSGRLVGCFLYHGRPGGVGRVLQVLAAPKEFGAIVDCLFDDARSIGLSGLRGRCVPHLTEALLTRNCIFLHRASTVIHTADEELADAVQLGKGLITGLAGESWTRLVGDDFR